MSRQRYLLLRLLLWPLAFVLCLELLARLATPVPEYVESGPFDPDLGFRSPPDLSLTLTDERGEFPFRLNADGFRGGETLPDRWEDPSSRRLLFVGDSFLIGWRVREEELIPTVTARLLESRGVPARVASLASDGYGTVQQLILLRRFLSSNTGSLPPDVVILCFFTGNDVADNSMALIGRTRVSPGGYVRPYLVPARGGMRTTWLHPWRARLRRTSRIFQLAELRLLGSGRLDSHERAPGAMLTDGERIAAGLLPRAYLNLFAVEPDAEWERAWEHTLKLVGQFRDEVRAVGARLVVAVIPHKFQVQRDGEYRSLEARISDADGLPLETQLDWDRPERRLATALEDAGMSVVLLLEALRRQTASLALSMYQYDGHLNASGHRVAGERIATALTEWHTVEPDERSERTAPVLPQPVDLPALVLARQTRFDFAEDPRPELFGRGWHGWAADWWGSVSGWAMSRRGELLVPNRAGTLVLRGWLPEGARLPARLRIDGTAHRIEGPGEFTVRHRLRRLQSATAVRRVVLRLRTEVPLWNDPRGRRCGLILQACEVRSEPADPSSEG